MARSFLMGIEGGATRTTGVLATPDLEVVARRQGGPANVHAVGEAAAAAALAGIVGGLLDEAGAGWGEVAAAALCMAGLRRQGDFPAWERIVAEAGLAAPHLLTHDAAAGLAAGSPDRTGILAICGTGSLAYGRRADGREDFVGGWGPVLGDAGSGFDMGQRALRAAIRSADGRGPRTLLERLVPERLGLGGLDDLVAWVSPFAKDRVAAVAPLAFEAADAGDATAQGILDGAADELAGGIEVVARRLWPEGADGGPGRIVLAGGVLAHQPAFRAALAERAARFAPKALCALPEAEGAVGAARVAREWKNG